MRHAAGYGKKSKLLILGTILLLALGVFVGCSNSGDKEVVAKIDDQVITKDELYNAMVEQSGPQVLEGLIAEKIVDAEAKKEKIKITDEDIEEELEKMVEEAGGEAQFEQLMTYYGYDKEEMKKNIATNLKIKKLVGPNIKVTDDQIEDYFLANKEDYDQLEEVKASHILVDTEEEAKEIYDKLQNGGDFAELAKEHSKDGSASLGGDLGYFGKDKMVKEFSDVAFSIEIGKVSEPVKSQFGYHIIKVEDKKEAKEASLEDKKDEIKDAVFENEVGPAYQEWYKAKLEEYKVENKLIKE